MKMKHPCGGVFLWGKVRLGRAFFAGKELQIEGKKSLIHFCKIIPQMYK